MSRTFITSFKQQSMEIRLQRTRTYWQQWLSDAEIDLPDFHKLSLQHGYWSIKAHCDVRGSVLATVTSSIFNYGRDYYCYVGPAMPRYAHGRSSGSVISAKRNNFRVCRDNHHRTVYLMPNTSPTGLIGHLAPVWCINRHKELAIQEERRRLASLFMIGEFYEASQDKTLIEIST